MRKDPDTANEVRELSDDKSINEDPSLPSHRIAGPPAPTCGDAIERTATISDALSDCEITWELVIADECAFDFGSCRRFYWLKSGAFPIVGSQIIVDQKRERILDVRSVVAFLGYLTLTTAIFLPDWNSFTTKIIDLARDSQLFLWNHWWVKHAIVDLHVHPFFCSAEWYPEGTSLLFDSFSPMNGLLAIPLSYLFPPTLTYNLLVAQTFLTSGWFFYLFARSIGCQPGAAFLAGLWYTLSGFHVQQSANHLHLTSCQFVPLFLLFVSLGIQTGKTRWAIAAAVALLCNQLCDTFFLLMCLPIGGIYWLAEWRGSSADSVRRSNANRFLWKFIVAGILIVGPLFGSMLLELLLNPMDAGRNPILFRLDPLMLFVPGPSSAWGSWTTEIQKNFPTWTGEQVGWFGITMMIGVFLGITTRFRKTATWLFCAILFFGYALGPSLKFFGTETGLSTPYTWLHQLFPTANIIGTPVRVVFGMMICCVVIAAIGWNQILSGRANGQYFFLILLAVTLIELWPARFHYADFSISERDRAALLAIRTEHGDFAVLTAESFYSPAHKFYQTIHERPIIGGFLSRWKVTQREEFEAIPLIPVFYGMRTFNAIDLPLSKTRLSLIDQRVKFVICINEDLSKLAQQIELTLEYAGDQFKIYRVPSKF